MIPESSVAAEPGGLEALAGLAQDPTLEKAVPLLGQVANDGTFVSERDLPLLLREAEGADEWYVAPRIEGEDGSYSLKVFVWPPGRGTRSHDHTSWGVRMSSGRAGRNPRVRAPPTRALSTCSSRR